MAWNSWYHLMANTYGTWLPGDPRGFRTRGHREHVKGDYKSPPPRGKYDDRHRHAQSLLARAPVLLSPEAGGVAVEAFRHALVDVHQLDVLAIAVTEVHLHVLLRLPPALKKEPTLSKRGLRASSIDDPARHYLGVAKKECSKALSAKGLVAPGGVWAKRGKVKPIRDRDHYLNAYPYILDHAERYGLTHCTILWRVMSKADIRKPTL